MFLDRVKDLFDEWMTIGSPNSPARAYPTNLRTRMLTYIFCILDISGSMKEKDFPPNRLKAGIQAISEFTERRRIVSPTDRLAVICFESEAHLLQPLTSLENGTHFRRLMRRLSGVRAGGGTRLDYAFQLAHDCAQLSQNDQPMGQSPQLRCLVLTDGHSEGNPELEADRLKEWGVVIEIIGIGGSPEEVNEHLLKRCASIENGRILYRFIGDGDSEALVQHFGRLALK